MYLPSIIIPFIILNLIMASFYFFLFAKDSRGRFIRYWGICWIFYSLSLLFLILYMNNPVIYYIGFRKVFDMLNIVYLLFGAYAFIRIQIPSYWYRFSLYMLLWLGIGTFYQFDLMSLFLPIATYQIIITCTLCFLIYRNWRVSKFEKALSISIFLLWGIGKAVFSLFETRYMDVFGFYLTEIIFSNILNFCIFIIYIQKARLEISRADRLFKIIAENATDVIFYYSLTPQKGFTYITPSVEKMVGYSVHDFYTNPRFYLELVPPEEFDAAAEIFEVENPLDFPCTKVFPIVHKNGGKMWAEFSLSLIKESGEPVAIEGFIRDITRMKKAEKDLIASRQSRELLLSYVSHELRTPITSILGYVSALKDGTISEKQEIESAMDIIIKKSLTLERLINDLFQLSKLETKQFSFCFTKIEALELAINLVNKHILEIQTAELDLEYKIDYPALTDFYVYADPERIDQVFSNIISNAIKYTNPRDKLTIKIGLTKKKDALSVSVTDTGVGVCKDDLPFLFDRFYKSSSPTENRNASSTGLGLTICKEIMDAHKGSIEVKSKLDRGSTFTFTVPVYVDNSNSEERG